MSLPSFDLTVSNQLVQFVAQGVNALRRQIIDHNRDYIRFWSLDRAASIAAFNADLPRFMVLFQSHNLLGTALNSAAIVANLEDRATVVMPDWIAFNGTQFELVVATP